MHACMHARSHSLTHAQEDEGDERETQAREFGIHAVILVQERERETDRKLQGIEGEWDKRSSSGGGGGGHTSQRVHGSPCDSEGERGNGSNRSSGGGREKAAAGGEGRREEGGRRGAEEEELHKKRGKQMHHVNRRKEKVTCYALLTLSPSLSCDRVSCVRV